MVKECKLGFLVVLKDVPQCVTATRCDQSTSAVKTSWESWDYSAWRRLQGHLTVAFQYPKGAIKMREMNFFIQVESGRMRGDGSKWKSQV